MRALRYIITICVFFLLAHADGKTVLSIIAILSLTWTVGSDIYMYLKIYFSGEIVEAVLAKKKIPLTWGNGLNVLFFLDMEFSFEYGGEKLDEIKPLGLFQESPCEKGEITQLKYLPRYPETVIFPRKGLAASYVVFMMIGYLIFLGIAVLALVTG